MRLIAIACAALALSSCSSDVPSTGVGGSVFRPLGTVSAVVSPQVLVFTPVTTSACAFVPPFDTDFSLLVTTGGQRMTVDSVTLQLNDGSSVGGPMVTFPRPDLEHMFGSLVIVDSRTFGFHQPFGCGSFQPRSLVVEMFAIGSDGARRRMTTTVPIR